jgi:ubiquinone/menaquinone biosynthesis C-methylase UbiE
MAPLAEFADLERKDHTARYEYAAQFVEGAIVLDAGCGAGYGLDFLSRTCKVAVGTDISSSALAFAKHRYSADLQLFHQDASALGFRDEMFDIVISFEMIEHLSQLERFLEDVRRVLKRDGLFIVSTPNKTYMSPGRKTPVWKWHKQEFYCVEFDRLLKQYFRTVTLLGQSVSNAAWQSRLQRVQRVHKYLSIVPTSVLRLAPMSVVMAIIRPPPSISKEEVRISQDNIEAAENFIGIARK